MSRFAASAPPIHRRGSSMTSGSSSSPIAGSYTTLPSTPRASHGSGSGPVREADEWDDDAWGDQSDDESFNKRAVTTTAGAGAVGDAPPPAASGVGAGVGANGAGASPAAKRQGSLTGGYGAGLWGFAFGGGASKKEEKQKEQNKAEEVKEEGVKIVQATSTSTTPSASTQASSSTSATAGLEEGVRKLSIVSSSSRPSTANVAPSPPSAPSSLPSTSQLAPIPIFEGEQAALPRRESVIAKTESLRAIQDNVEDLVKDPVNALKRMHIDPTLDLTSPQPVSSSTLPSVTGAGGGKQETAAEAQERRDRRKRDKIITCLSAEDVVIAELRKLSWAGIPSELRPVVWQLLLGYLPAPASRRAPTLSRKRQEYADAVRLAFAKGATGLDQAIWHQIRIDVPRTNPGVRLWQFEATQRSLERILYVWAIRHPASGYVQGINDLVTPFFQVFLSSYITVDPETFDPSVLPPGVFDALEADAFWCLSKLLDGIQDNYIFAQPGIQRQVARMKELCGRVDAPLAAHLEEQNVEFIQFAFRWMNCLLMREMSVNNIIRLWDTYLSEGTDAFSEFHVYVCLAFLVKWSEKLRSMDFQGIIMFLQSLPTQAWTEQNTELLLSEGFMWKSLFHDSGHFTRK